MAYLKRFGISLCVLLGLVFLGCSKSEKSGEASAAASATAGVTKGQSSQETNAGKISCALAPPELVGSMLGLPGLTLRKASDDRYPGFASCSYGDNDRGVILTLKAGKFGGPSAFASDKKQAETVFKGVPVTAIEGLGDEAYYHVLSAMKVSSTTVAARKGDLVVSVSSASADLTKIKALVAKLLDSQ